MSPRRAFRTPIDRSMSTTNSNQMTIYMTLHLISLYTICLYMLHRHVHIYIYILQLYLW